MLLLLDDRLRLLLLICGDQFFLMLLLLLLGDRRRLLLLIFGDQFFLRLLLLLFGGRLRLLLLLFGGQFILRLCVRFDGCPRLCSCDLFAALFLDGAVLLALVDGQFPLLRVRFGLQCSSDGLLVDRLSPLLRLLGLCGG